METWTISDVGIVRRGSVNEDICKVKKYDEHSLLAAVCDGMGGANAGEIASEMAINTFMSHFEEFFDLRESKLEQAVKNAVHDANSAVYDASQKSEGLLGMGTTLVAALCSENRAMIANVGDSRAYHITEDGIFKITEDHSLVSELVKSGQLSSMEARRHPSRNLITRALGVEPEVECDIYCCDVKKGEFILLCSDGLHDQVSEPEIYYEVYETGKPQSACENLVKTANQRGGSDNVTIVLIAF